MAHREVPREALTGVSIGQPLSRERILIPGADAFHSAEGNTLRRVIRECRGGPARSLDPGMWIRALYGSREISGPTGGW